MINIDTNQLIEGPSLLVDQLLSDCDIDDMKQIRGLCVRATDNTSPIRIIQSDKHNDTVYESRRVGLRHTDDRNDWWTQRYRLPTNPHLLKKGRKLLIGDMRNDGIDNDTIMRINQCCSRSLSFLNT
jgi:hypothetical protein